MQISKRLMNGMVLMYHGDAIVNYDGQTGDHITTLGLKYWYCMNGQSSQPDMRNKFARCESTAGNEGGHDDDELIAHTHGTTGSGGISHSHSLAAVGDHDHSSLSQAITFGLANRYQVYAGWIRSPSSNSTTSNGGHVHTVTTSSGNHSHTLNDPGGSVTGKNMPKYSGLQFIRRSR